MSESRPGRVPCPCCGYPTLSARAVYDICRLCWWEHDGQDDPHADEVWGGPNGDLSLTQARANFRRFGTIYEPGKDPRVGGTDSASEADAKQAIVAALKRLRAGVPPAEAERLWAIIEAHEGTLDAETERKVRDYERRSRRR